MTFYLPLFPRSKLAKCKTKSESLVFAISYIVGGQKGLSKKHFCLSAFFSANFLPIKEDRRFRVQENLERGLRARAQGNAQLKAQTRVARSLKNKKAKFDYNLFQKGQILKNEKRPNYYISGKQFQKGQMATLAQTCFCGDRANFANVRPI